jgi:4Fe-4S ferredoxin
MPLKTLKKDSADTQTLEWILQVKHYKLTLDKKRCKGCEICSLACPKDAIKIQKQPKTSEGKAQKAHVDFDLSKCTFCGICDITCPYNAVKVTLNDSHDLSVLNRESYPQLIRDITVNSKPCPKDCQECQTACPLDLITVTKTDFSGNPVTDVNTLSPSARKRVDVNVQIQKEHCPTCKVCEAKCPVNTIKVNKTFEGTIKINRQKCPEGCTNCIDVCPITGALYLGEDKKVHVNQIFCTYCGACKNVCPVEEALCLNRTRIHHTPVHSGTWNKALQRLTSNLCATKELTAQADEKRREALMKRFAANSRW